MATERAKPLPDGVQLSLIVDMLHVGLEHVGSLHVVLHMLWVAGVLVAKYRLLLLFDRTL